MYLFVSRIRCKPFFVSDVVDNSALCIEPLERVSNESPLFHIFLYLFKRIGEGIEYEKEGTYS